MSRKDIIRWVIDRMLAHDDSITQELALTVEREARAEWGGQRIEYVPKTCGHVTARKPAPLDRSVVEAIDQGMPARQAGAEHGISRATVYRMLKRTRTPS